jgi:hypothetical protein
MTHSMTLGITCGIGTLPVAIMTQFLLRSTGNNKYRLSKIEPRRVNERSKAARTHELYLLGSLPERDAPSLS